MSERSALFHTELEIKSTLNNILEPKVETPNSIFRKANIPSYCFPLILKTIFAMF